MTSLDRDRAYALWLFHLEGLTGRERRMLVETLGSAQAVYQASERTIGEILGRLYFPKRETPGEILCAYRNLTECGMRFIGCEDDEFPEQLGEIPSPVYGLFVSGEIPDLTDAVAIVGARRCSAYGKRVAQRLGEALAREGISVVSGMARGIDSTAQAAVVEAGGATLAVLACGVDVCYPGELKKLYLDIRKTGCILSEFAPGTQPLARQFPSRNRIISGLAKTIVIVEAAEQSGSLITADMALEQGKDIFAVPGRIGDSQSAGCNSLIAQGAGIITDIDAFVAELAEGRSRPGNRENKEDRENRENRKNSIRAAADQDNVSQHAPDILGLLDDDPRTIDELESELSASVLLQKLTLLEIEGKVYQQTPGKYVRL